MEDVISEQMKAQADNMKEGVDPQVQKIFENLQTEPEFMYQLLSIPQMKPLIEYICKSMDTQLKGLGFQPVTADEVIAHFKV